MYKVMVKNAKVQCGMVHSSGASRLEQLCSQLKEDLEFKEVDVVASMQIYDRQETGKVDKKTLLTELKSKKIKLSDDDYDLLLTQINVDKD